MVNIRPDEISSIIRQQIESYDQDAQTSNVGTVLQVGDGCIPVFLTYFVDVWCSMQPLLLLPNVLCIV